MDQAGKQPVILVGFGGSGASSAALIWAAREALRRSAALQVVQAWQPHPARAPYAGTGHGSGRSQQASAGSLAGDVRAVLAGALGAEAGNLDLVIDLLEGTAERVLAETSVDADLLVLGSGGQSPVAHHDPLITDRPVGPVVRACLSHSRCPVVIVGPAATGQDPDPAAQAWRYSMAATTR